MYSQNDISLKVISKDTIDCQPGENITASLLVENLSDTKLTIRPKISLPLNWHVVMFPDSIPIKAKGKAFKIFSFHVPGNCGQKEFKIHISAGEGSGQVTQSVPVRVKAVYNYTVEKIKSQDFVIAGHPVELAYTIRNNSNTEAQFKALMESGKSKQDIEFSLVPGADTSISYSISTNEDLSAYLRKSLNFSVSINGDLNTQKTISHVYNLIPSSKTKFDPFNRFPVKAGTLIAYDNRVKEMPFASVFEISGATKIKQLNNGLLSFQLRGPDHRGEAVISSQDNYYLKFKSARVHLTIGDDNYRASDLTESSRSGRGIKAETLLNKWILRAFLNVPRFYPDLKNVTGLSIGWNSGKKVYLAANVVSKVFQSESLALIGSGNMSYVPVKWLKIDGEISGARAANQYTKAWLGNVNIKSKRFKAHLNCLQSDKNFPGYYSDSRIFASGINVNVFKGGSLELRYSGNTSNLALDTLYLNAPYSANASADLNIKIGRKTMLSTGVSQRKLDDRMEIKMFSYTESMARFSMNYFPGKLNLSATGEYGKLRNYLKSTEGQLMNTSKLSVSMKYQFSDNTKLSLFGNYLGSVRYLSPGMNDINYGASFVTYLNKVNINVRYTSNYELQEYYHDRNILELSSQWRFNQFNEIDLAVNYNLLKNSLDKKELKMYLRFLHTFNIPLSKKENLGSLKGRIINKGVENVEGLVVSVCGSIAVTDKDGNFYFPNLEAGECVLLIDDSRTGLNSIPSRPGPYLISILPGRENYFEITYMQSAQILGSLLIQEDNRVHSKGYVALSEDFESVVVEIKRDNELFRAITNRDGKFLFKDLRPGKWTLKVYTNNLPEGFELTQESMEVDLQPGENKDINIQIRKKARKVRFQKSFQSK